MAISREAAAFLLVIAAGACTTIGSSVVFFPVLANLAKPSILAISLGFAAGIMVYISLVDIYQKSIVGFQEDEFEDGDAFIYATLSFFGGCLLMMGLDVVVDKLLLWDSKKHGTPSSADETPHDHCHPHDAHAIDKMREDFESKVRADEKEKEDGVADANADESSEDIKAETGLETGRTTEEGSGGAKLAVVGDDGNALSHMGWAMAASIAIHNFPEGMVTYLAYITEPAVGVALAVGIAVHNVPEGLCVAMPLYYATGRRFYSFMWGTLSGLTEPIGALVVWLILQDGISGTANGILFGLVSGMMTVISIDELLPTAHKYAANPKHVTYSFLFGLLFIAASLMLFSI